MKDIRDRWMEILEETTSEYSLDDLININVESLNEVGRPTARNQMSRAGTGGDPLTSRGANAYDDISDEEKTLGETDDPITEALRATRMLKEDGGEGQERGRRRMSSIQSIRTSLESVWQMLGKAETKLGAAEFSADDVGIESLQNTIDILSTNVAEIMARIEATRDQVTLKGVKGS